MKKLFTLLTLLVAIVTSAWADEVIYSMTSVTSLSGTDVTVNNGAYTVASKKTATVEATFSGGTATVYNAKNAAAEMFNTSNSKINLGGSGSSYFLATLTTAIAEGDVITSSNTVANSFKIGKTTSNGSATKISFPYTVPSESPLIGEKTIYVFKSGDTGTSGTFTSFTITRPQPKAPVFAPASGESVAAGSKITVTSQYATSIQYKWTADDTTPTDGWSDYDAEAKITVPAAADGTPYLHVQSVRSGVTGTTTGYAQYTITAPDTEAPTLSSTTPADAATNVAVAGNIVLTFNENVACTTNATLTPAGGAAINLTPTVDGATVTYTYTGLTHSKSYTFSLAANSVEDVSGNKYASAISFGFTTIQETVANPTFDTYGHAFQIKCATNGAKIYYTIDDDDPKNSASKAEFTLTGNNLMTLPASGTIYAYAEKEGAITSDVVSKAITVPTGSPTGNLLITLVPDASGNDDEYAEKTFSKAGYTMVSTDKILNTDQMPNYRNMFKVNAGTFTITPPANVTIQSVKVYAIKNSNKSTTTVTVGDGYTVTTTSNVVIPRYTYYEDGNGAWSEIVLTKNTPAEAGTFVFAIGSQSRMYVEVYGTTSATSQAITPTYNKSTYVTTTPLDFSGVAGLKAYVATAAAGGSVTLAEVGAVPTGTPLMLVGTAGTEYTVPVAASASEPGTNMFRAGDGTTTFNGSTFDYILFSDGLFYQIGSGAVPVGKAYLHCTSDPTTAGAPALSIIIDGEDINGNTTGIDSVKASHKANGEYYNLAGQRVANPAKGLYIVNGKKYMVK